MAFDSPTRSSPTLDRYLRHGSGSKGSHSQTIYAMVPTKPKKFQSAHYDETTGTWRCKSCGYTYPNPEPHHHQRRAHKKICHGGFGKVHRWLSLSTGEEAEDSKETSNVVDKPTTPETSASPTIQHALGQQDKNAGFMPDREFKFHQTPSDNEVPRESEIEEAEDSKGILSDQHGFMAAGENSEARRKEELDSEPVTEEDFKPRTGDLGRLLTLNSDFSIPREFSQDRSYPVDFSGVASSDFVPVTDVSASGNEEGRDIDKEEPLSRSSQDEAHSLKVGEDVLTADDALKKRTEGAQGIQSTLTSSDENGWKDLAAEELGEDFHQREPSLNAADDDTEEKTVDVGESEMITTEHRNAEELRGEGFGEAEAILSAVPDGALTEKGEDIGSEQGIVTIGGDGAEYKSGDESSQLVRGVGDGEASQHATPKDQSGHGVYEKVGGLDGHHEAEESEMITTEHRNAEELRGEGFGETEAILPAVPGIGALTEKGEDIGSEQGIVTIGGDGAEYKSGDESSQLVRGVGDGEASQHATPKDQSGHVVHATEEVGGLDGHHEAEEVDVISLEPLSDDAEGVTETPPKTSRTGQPVKLSLAERNWDDWEHVVSGDETSGKEKMPPLRQEMDDEGPPFSEDGLTSSQSDNLEDDTAHKNAPTLESGGTAVSTSEQEVGHEIGFQPAGLDWTLAFPDTVKKDVDKQQLVDSLESSTSAGNHSSPDQDGQELIPGLDQETDQTNKMVAVLSAAEANWEDWEDVIKRGPMLMEGITLREEQDPESSDEGQSPRPDSVGDVKGLGQGKTGTVSEFESFVEGGVIDTAAAKGLPVHIPDSENSDWLIDFSEPSVEENNSGTANEEVISATTASSPKLEVSGTKILDLLDLNEGSGHEQGASLLDSIPVTQSETGQSSKALSQLSSALRNWEDWDHVVRESERISRPERSSPVLESDLGDGEHENGLESPNRADSNIVDSSSSKQQGLVKPPVAANSDRAAMNSGQEVEGLSHGKQPDAMLTSVPQEADPLFRFPEAELEPKVSSSSLPKNLNVLDSGRGAREGTKEVDDNEDTSRYESGQAGGDNLWEDDWEVVQKNEYPSAGSRHSSPSFEDAHDEELSSEHEYPTGLPTAVNLPLGTRRWADWEDLTKSEYMVLDGPDGESLVFKRTSGDRDKLSAKALGGRRDTSPSFEELNDDGGSPSLRRRRRQAPSFDDDRSFRSLKGASPRGVVKSDYSAGSNSFQGFQTTSTSLPGSSPRKSESEDVAPLVTRRPLIYRGSRRDYASEVEDQDVTSEPPLGDHLHHHSHHEHENALKYDVERVLRGQTTYELICPICGALITRKIIIRKKKRRFVSEEDPRWRRGTTEITPVEDDGNQSPRSDVSSQIEDQSGAWKQGVRPCFGYFFAS